MAENKLKPLVIRTSTSAQPGGIEYKWGMLPQPEVFIKEIEIPELNSERESQSQLGIGAIISGMPSVFARANWFRDALDFLSEPSSKNGGLLRFFQDLIEEWRGFIACIALNNSDITVRRIELQYSDGKSTYDTSNIYEPVGAFGRMLFDREILWKDQEKDVKSSENKPFIDVVKFKNKVVGATSPDSLLFTSVSYSIDEKLPYVRNGKFADPLTVQEIAKPQLETLIGFINHILKELHLLEEHYNKVEDVLKPNYKNVKNNLQSWVDNLRVYAEKKGWVIKEQVPEISRFQIPYSLIFNHSTELYGRHGAISGVVGSDAIPFDPKQLLLSEETEIVRIKFPSADEKEERFLDSKPILLLKASVKGQRLQYAYFTLPLTPLALNVFGDNLDNLLGIGIDNNKIPSRLFAEYDESADKVTVNLKLVTDQNDERTFEIKYPVATDEIFGKDIILWPNFISKKWTRYFLYSELPHNNTLFQVHPFVGLSDDVDFRIVFDKDSDEPVFLSNGGSINPSLPSTINAKLHIASTNATGKYKYEVYECNQPFKGLKFTRANKTCGYSIIRYGDKYEQQLPKNLIKEVDGRHSEARIGIDFGSTNTSVACYDIHGGKIIDDFQLKNRRVSLLSFRGLDSDEPTSENQLFFFQGESKFPNSLKSMLTLHDSKLVVRSSHTLSGGEAVKGGFPNFVRNLPIVGATENRYKLSFQESGNAEVVYNMKWTDTNKNPEEETNKKAYLGSLLLHIYAELFERRLYPAELNWSYPSSMGTTLLTQNANIWNDLGVVNPLAEEPNLKVASKPAINSASEIESGSPFNQSGFQDTSYQSMSGFDDGLMLNSGWESSSQQNTAPSYTPSASTQQSDFNNSFSTEFNKKREFNFEKLTPNRALSEACAVANYLAKSRRVEVSQSTLTICFDIGGSTTDISALCQMPGDDAVSMVKQNSIRFAAQRVSNSARYAPHFHTVLLEICQRYNFSVQGLNKAPHHYSPELAPYYFEQIVDRLNTEDEFATFYRLLAARCPEMFSVNLYVTGLIMYYAGQLTFRLQEDIINSAEGEKLKTAIDWMQGEWTPKINIVFAGKGARIFDWLKSFDGQLYDKYYKTLFILGFGGMERAKEKLLPKSQRHGIPNIAINPTGSNRLKYEVSEGLAHPTETLKVPKNDEAIEILGEEHFYFHKNGKPEKLSYDSPVTKEMMRGLGTTFMSSVPTNAPPCPKFMDFAGIFFNVATKSFGLKMSQDDFFEGFRSMKINAFIKNLPEYQLALRDGGKDFDFVAPIIILEGMLFLEETLLPHLKKGN